MEVFQRLLAGPLMLLSAMGGGGKNTLRHGGGFRGLTWEGLERDLENGFKFTEQNRILDPASLLSRRSRSRRPRSRRSLRPGSLRTHCAFGRTRRAFSGGCFPRPVLGGKGNISSAMAMRC